VIAKVCVYNIIKFKKFKNKNLKHQKSPETLNFKYVFEKFEKNIQLGKISGKWKIICENFWKMENNI
jgi:hypothetical protein